MPSILIIRTIVNEALAQRGRWATNVTTGSSAAGGRCRCSPTRSSMRLEARPSRGAPTTSWAKYRLSSRRDVSSRTTAPSCQSRARISSVSRWASGSNRDPPADQLDARHRPRDGAVHRSLARARGRRRSRVGSQRAHAVRLEARVRQLVVDEQRPTGLQMIERSTEAFTVPFRGFRRSRTRRP